MTMNCGGEGLLLKTKKGNIKLTQLKIVEIQSTEENES